MSDPSRVDFPDERGNLYNFYPAPIEALDRKLTAPAVFICARQVDGKWDVIYVGETDNFSTVVETSTAVLRSRDEFGATHVLRHPSAQDRETRLKTVADLRTQWPPRFVD